MTHPCPRWLVVALLGLAGALLTAAPAAGGTPLADGAEPRLVVVGAPGLAWSDVEGAELPALDRLADAGLRRLPHRPRPAQPVVRRRRVAHAVVGPPRRRPRRSLP